MTFWLYTGYHVNPLLGLLVIVPAAFVINWLVYTWLLEPLVNRAKNRGQLEVNSSSRRSDCSSCSRA